MIRIHSTLALAAIRTLMLLVLTATAQAHTASNSFIYWGEHSLRLDLSLQDMQRLSDLDTNADAALSWAEVKSAEDGLAPLITSKLRLVQAGEDCVISPVLTGVSSYSDGKYAVWQLASPCLAQPAQSREVRYKLLFDLDPLHRALYRIEIPGEERVGVLSPAADRIRGDDGGGIAVFAMFFREGIIHLITGYDHLLFLAALLLPYLKRAGAGNGRLSSVDRRDIFWVITAFTLSHSLSLVLATFSIVSLPSGPVEVAIAFSIGVAALLGLRGAGREQRYLAGAFGLLHGLGFATMLSGLLAATEQKALALFGFNVGIELAQLAVVLAVAPPLLLMGRWQSFRRVFYPGSAVALVVMSAVWGVQRLA